MRCGREARLKSSSFRLAKPRWNGGNNALDGKHWPADFYIDYVRVWQDEINVGCDPPNFPTKKYIEKHQEWYGTPVTPRSTDTCPESYPTSAHEHAARLIANAAKAHTPLTRDARRHFGELRPPAATLATAPLISLAAAQQDTQPAGQQAAQQSLQPTAQQAARWW